MYVMLRKFRMYLADAVDTLSLMLTDKLLVEDNFTLIKIKQMRFDISS